MRINVFLFLIIPLCSYALEVEGVKWGFDGKAVPERLIPLTITVSNPTDTNFDGIINLKRSNATGMTLGAVQAEPCYLAPFTQKMIQFMVLVNDTNDDWYLQWGNRINERYDLPRPSYGAPAVIILFDAQDPFSRPRGLPGFPQQAFPISPAATEGLSTIALGHNPQLDKAQKLALLGWLFAGGNLHLFAMPQSGYPVIEGLAPQAPGMEGIQYYGGGKIQYHSKPLAEYDSSALKALGIDLLKMDQDTDYYYQNLDEIMLVNLGQLVKADHNWGVMYTLIALYIILIGPVNYLLGRRNQSFTVPLIFYVSLITVFAIIFGIAGRRGYGETTRMHTITYARQTGPERFCLNRWANVFVTNGDVYEFTEENTFSAFTTAQSTESVNGVIQNGLNGTFAVDMPLYSKRGFIQNTEMALPGRIEIKAQARDADNLSDLSITGIPAAYSGQAKAWAVYQGWVYPLMRTDGGWKFREGGLTAWEEFMDHDLGDLDSYSYSYNTDITSIDDMQGIDQALITRALGGNNSFDFRWSVRKADDERLSVFLWLPTPDQFQLQHEDLGRSEGYTLMHFETILHIKETADE